MSDRKTVIFGVDGCPEEFLKKWMIEENKLPNFKRIYESGTILTMNSTIPYATFPAWISMLTGKSPGSLSLFYWFKRMKDSYEASLNVLEWEKWHPIWDILSENKRRSVIINVPTTVPPRTEFNGILVSGPVMNTDPLNIAYPESLNKRLLKEGYIVDLNFSLKHNPGKNLKKLLETTQSKIALAKELFSNEKWDLFMFTFFFIDALLHNFWKYFDESHPDYEENSEFQDSVIKYYQLIDEHLGFYLDNLPDNTHLFIVSDHGMGKQKSQIDLNTWLYENGFLTLRDDKEKQVTLSGFQNSALYRPLRQVYLALQNIGFLKRFRNYIWKTIPEDIRTWENVDWNTTKAYSLGKNFIFVNLKDREPQGIIRKGKEYDTVIEEIIEKLKEFKDPDNNEPVVMKVWKCPELYKTGKYDESPDLSIEFKDGSYYTSVAKVAAPVHSLFNKVITADHKRNTIFGCYGPDIQPGKKTDVISIFDITPTILHTMNIPIPENIDGKVVLDIFKDDSDSGKRNIRYISVKEKDELEKASDEEDKIIFDRLKDIGYI